MNSAGGRAEFARQLHNILHLEVEDDGDTDTKSNTYELDQRILFLKSLHTKDDTQGTKRKRRRLDGGVGAGSSEGGGVQGTKNTAELGAHGYEVQPQVIVDANGGTVELFLRGVTTFVYLYPALTLCPRCRLMFALCIDRQSRATYSSRRKFAMNRTS